MNTVRVVGRVWKKSNRLVLHLPPYYLQKYAGRKTEVDVREDAIVIVVGSERGASLSVIGKTGYVYSSRIKGLPNAVYQIENLKEEDGKLVIYAKKIGGLL